MILFILRDGFNDIVWFFLIMLLVVLGIWIGFLGFCLVIGICGGCDCLIGCVIFDDIVGFVGFFFVLELVFVVVVFVVDWFVDLVVVLVKLFDLDDELLVDVVDVVIVVLVIFFFEVIVVFEDKVVCSELFGNFAVNVIIGVIFKFRRMRIFVKISSWFLIFFFFICKNFFLLFICVFVYCFCINVFCKLMIC